MPRPSGSKSRRTSPSRRQLAELAESCAEEGLRSIRGIARGDVRSVNPAPISNDAAVVDEWERWLENAVHEELWKLHVTPVRIRLAAWIELLNRARDKPFQSEMVREEEGRIKFKDADDLRKQLIEHGIPPLDVRAGRTAAWRSGHGAPRSRGGLAALPARDLASMKTSFEG